jgi:hypothetical protein
MVALVRILLPPIVQFVNPFSLDYNQLFALAPLLWGFVWLFEGMLIVVCIERWGHSGLRVYLDSQQLL